jgi:hypothetical protein
MLYYNFPKLRQVQAVMTASYLRNRPLSPSQQCQMFAKGEMCDMEGKKQDVVKI